MKEQMQMIAGDGVLVFEAFLADEHGVTFWGRLKKCAKIMYNVSYTYNKTHFYSLVQ